MYFQGAYAEIQMNGTIFGTPTANITVTSPVTAQSVQLDSSGLTTRFVAGDSLHTYYFDRVTNSSAYSVYWTGLSSSEIDFTIATMGLSDVRTTTTAPQLGIVQIDNVNTPYSWTGTVNTILVNAGQKIQEFFIPSTGGGGSIGGSGSGPLPVSPPTTQVNVTCGNGVYDPTTSTCKFGSVNVNILPTTVTTLVDGPAYGSIVIQCSGANSLTVQNVDLGNNPLGVILGQIPTTLQCGPSIANTCPTGMSFADGQCSTPIACPIGSLTSNGQCVGQLSCPVGTTQQGSQCTVPATCTDGTLPVNGQCMNNGISFSVPQNPPAPCDLTNPISCIIPMSSTETVSINGITDSAQAISGTTSITKITNPQMTQEEFIMSLMVIGIIIIGATSLIFFRHHKSKPKTRKEAKSGTDKTIKEFNKDVRRNKPDKKTKKK